MPVASTIRVVIKTALAIMVRAPHIRRSPAQLCGGRLRSPSLKRLVLAEISDGEAQGIDRNQGVGHRLPDDKNETGRIPLAPQFPAVGGVQHFLEFNGR